MGGIKLNPDDETRAQFESWVAERPPAVRAVAEKLSPFHCYRIRGNSVGHYALTEYNERKKDGVVTVCLVHGADSFWPGVGVFGVLPDDLQICDCGKWEWASDALIKATAKRLEEHAAQMRRAGLVKGVN